MTAGINYREHSSHKNDSSWATAARATLHCLTGCAIGEVLGMIIANAVGLANLPSIILSVVLAFMFGYALTLRPLVSAGLPFRRAGRVALAADTVSITVMEIMDNVFLLAVPGALAAGLADGLFWWSLAASLVAAFVITMPVNRAMIARGKGHAAVHAYH